MKGFSLSNFNNALGSFSFYSSSFICFMLISCIKEAIASLSPANQFSRIPMLVEDGSRNLLFLCEEEAI